MLDYLAAGIFVVLIGVVEEVPVVGYILQPSDHAALTTFKGVAVCPTFQPGYRRDGRDCATVTEFTTWMDSKKHKLDTAEGRESAKAALCAPGAPLFTATENTTVALAGMPAQSPRGVTTHDTESPFAASATT